MGGDDDLVMAVLRERREMRGGETYIKWFASLWACIVEHGAVVSGWDVEVDGRAWVLLGHGDLCWRSESR